MKKSLSVLITLVLMCGAQWANAQVKHQPLVGPGMDTFNLNTMDQRTNPGGLKIRGVGLATIRLAEIDIKKGQFTSSHNHAFEQMVLVQSGQIKAFSGENEYILGPGEMFAVPAFVHHYYTALEDSVTIEVFGPGGNFSPNTSVINPQQ